MMNLNDVLRKKVLKEYKSSKSNAILTIMKKEKEDENEDRLVNAISESENIKLTFVKKILNESKERKKGDEILVISKTSCWINHNNLLINIEMFKFQKFQKTYEGLCKIIYMLN